MKNKFVEEYVASCLNAPTLEQLSEFVSDIIEEWTKATKPKAYSRAENGVRHRVDGGGDAWAAVHRDLGTRFLMQDVDALFGCSVFGSNTGDRLFLEHVPDAYKHRNNEIRNFAVVAMFDRKTTFENAFSKNNLLSFGLYLWQCRTFASKQPIAPKFFFVIGGQEPPWAMQEINITTGDVINQPIEVDAQSFDVVWQTLGLKDMRNELRRWVEREGAAK